jgi:hypothetical protein
MCNFSYNTKVPVSCINGSCLDDRCRGVYDVGSATHLAAVGFCDNRTTTRPADPSQHQRHTHGGSSGDDDSGEWRVSREQQNVSSELEEVEADTSDDEDDEGTYDRFYLGYRSAADEASGHAGEGVRAMSCHQGESSRPPPPP